MFGKIKEVSRPNSGNHHSKFPSIPILVGLVSIVLIWKFKDGIRDSTTDGKVNKTEINIDADLYLESKNHNSFKLHKLSNPKGNISIHDHFTECPRSIGNSISGPFLSEAENVLKSKNIEESAKDKYKLNSTGRKTACQSFNATEQVLRIELKSWLHKKYFFLFFIDNR